MKVRDCDEGDLIARFVNVLPRGERTIVGSGDDCALISCPEPSFLVTTDTLVGESHFLKAWSTGAEIGARAAAQNLADIAAMGGRTSALVVSLVLRGDYDVDWLVDMVQAFGQRAREAGAGVVGGDLTGGEELIISVTAHGWVDGPPVLRSGARPGDIVAIAGTLGRSGAGLELLSRRIVDPSVHDDILLGDFAEAVRIYRAPEPPLEAGPIAARHNAHAMMDVSDGLVRDGGRMARASEVMLEIDSSLLVDDVEALDAAAQACGHHAMEWVLFGGEDHPMLATFPPQVVLPSPFRAIGVIGAVSPGDQPGIRLDGQRLSGGFDHFRQDNS